MIVTSGGEGEPNESDGSRVRELEAEVSRLHRMLANAPDFIGRMTVDGRFSYLNRLAPGFVMEDVLGSSFEQYVPPEYRDIARRALEQVAITRSTQQYAIAGMVAPGQLGRYLTRLNPEIEDGEVTSVVMVATDVTKLEESRTLLQVALDATGIGIWTYAPPAGVGSWDERTRGIFGVPEGTPAPSFEHLMTDYVHPEDRERVQKSLEGALQTGSYGPIQHRIVWSDGSVRWVSASGVAVPGLGAGVRQIVGSVQDITERHVFEARLLEAQKLESIGRLAGGVAHDFNNMLTAILGNVEQMAELTSIEAMREHLREIHDAAQRSSTLTAQLLAFARRQVMELRLVDPNRLVAGLQSLLRRVVGERIEIACTLSAHGSVRVDSGQFEQVVMNLVSNARDAMPNGGRITLSTRDVRIGASDALRVPEVPPGLYVAIMVSDTGVGIAADVLPHVFEPFFTTRPQGTGLGLATCHGIARQSGGQLVVESRLGEGATFTLYLPRLEPEDAPALAHSATARAVSERGNGRILVVEDEPAVRAILERTLVRRGYRVTTASNGEE
ncbi:MAG TPA: ATP-binding protein, partial [Polyangiaceae bacterium]|nr:ATP-binding protein [Polyangiaceae bacterium]